MNAQQLAAQLLGRSGSVGAVAIQPRMVGAYDIQPRMIGAPVQEVPSLNPMEQAVNYSPAAYLAGELSYLGFGATTIPAGAVVTVPITTQRPFKPQHMRNPSTVFGLLIQQVGLEGTNTFANVAGVPIELFSEVATAQQIEWPTIDPSTGIQFVVFNPTAGALVFSGAFYGTMLRR